MNTQLLLWVWVLWAGKTSALTTQGISVGVDTPQCELRKAELHCDYKDVNQMVTLGDLQTNGQIVDRIVVSNLQKMELGEVCVNIALHNVGNVMVVSNKGHQSTVCKTDLKITATNSVLDRLPSGVSRVSLESSTITSLATDTNIKQLNVVSSAVKVLDIAQPLTEGTTATFISSNIDTLQRLEMGNASKLTVQHTTIDVLASKGLILRGGNTQIKSSSIVTVLDDSVLLGVEATLNIENYSGQLRVGVLKYEEQKACTSDDHYFWAFIACVVILVVLCLTLLFMKCYKRKSSYHIVSHKHIHQTIETS